MAHDRWIPGASLAFIASYALALYFKFAAFVYTLEPHAFIWFWQKLPPLADRLPMFWFGFMTSALIVASLAAIVLRYIVAKPLRIPPFLFWATPACATVIIVTSQFSWFTK